MLDLPMSRRSRLSLPDPVTGYELDPERGWFSVVVPELTDSTNLITNPSFEVGTTGWGADAGSLARVTSQQRRGSASLQITPSGGYAVFTYGLFATVTGQWYSLSFDILGNPGVAYSANFGASNGVTLGTPYTFRGKGFWERITLNYYETAGASRRIYITQVAATHNNPFYVDGVQVEASSYATTYFDGDSTPVVPFTQSYYYWNGLSHASTSVRKARTPGGGKEVNLAEIGYRIVAAVGLGMLTVNNIATPISTGGALYQRAIPQAREFALAGHVYGESGEGDVQAVRRELVKLFDPLSVPQPVTLKYHLKNECGDSDSEIAQIPCVYQSGLEQNMDNVYQEKIGIVFKSYIPFVVSEGDTAVALGYSVTVSPANRIIKRNANGIWEAMGNGADNGIVQVIAAAPDGSIYVGGTFTQMAGVPNTAYIARWDPAALTWNALGTGTNGSVYALAFAADGSLYVGGAFTAAGGVANTRAIARWSSSTWSALGTGITDTAFNEKVYALAFDAAGVLYVGGFFEGAGGVANTAYLAKWANSAWSAVDTANPDGTVLTLLADSDHTLYVGGTFTAIGAIANTAAIAKWNITDSVWSALGQGFTAPDDTKDLVLAPDGTLYAGGNINLPDGTPLHYVAKYNGVAWSKLGDGVNGTVDTLLSDGHGLLYVGGYFQTADFRNLKLPDRMATWNGTTWAPLDVDLPGGVAHVYEIAMDKAGNLYLGYDTAGNAITAVVVVQNTGFATAYPRFIYNGPGTLSQIKNYSTGKTVFFKNLTLLAGENAVLAFSPSVGRTFVSNLRGDLSSYILPGSALDFTLVPGPNYVSSFIYGTTDANTAVSLVWQNWYSSLDYFTRRP